MFQNRKLPVVFAGPSLSQLSEIERCRIDLRPPVRRGDLQALLSIDSPRTVILIDGLFGTSMSVTPTECRHLLQKGWLVVGASSMGALRASELWSLGMVGVGDVFTLFRIGVLRSDADVAVAYHPDTFEEITASLVHVRSILSVLEQSAKISGLEARKLLNYAQRIYWYERSWQYLLAIWSSLGIDEDVIQTAKYLVADYRFHPKKRDALLAVRSVLAGRWTAWPDMGIPKNDVSSTNQKTAGGSAGKSLG
ncbi:TfuA-like protein [Nostoc sphaeroides]|uniref:TfuA domain protein core n=1 Tax=Nostoc sphaeroides CCNUC1 TaxID=2653204 RepID=A0A5P8WLQ8_9NOSO|nr:TfuA-like protein [Nostoc sphaeroides]QFS52829.1 TfuA domain protein core [Nostoc sphaeroides CCNUC1]